MNEKLRLPSFFIFMGMKIVFMGTPAFAAGFLESLLSSKHEVLAVVTQPDRPAGRGRTLTPPPVKVLAQEKGLKVIQPEDLKSMEFDAELRALNADLFVVVAYSILPKNILGASRLGAVNVHGSLLPKYRGAAPVQRAIAAGDKESGVTVFLLDEKMDHGPVLERRVIPIDHQDTSATLLDKMLAPGCEALAAAIDALESGNPQFLPQSHDQATPAPKLKKEEGKLDFSKSANELHDRIRAFSPWPGGYATLNGKNAYIRTTDTPNVSYSLEPGQVKFDSNRMFVGTGGGILEVLTIQLEGKREMPVADFVCGLQVKEGLRFC